MSEENSKHSIKVEGARGIAIGPDAVVIGANNRVSILAGRDIVIGNEDIASVFQDVKEQAESLPDSTAKGILLYAIRRLQEESTSDTQASEVVLREWLDVIAETDPHIWEFLASALASSTSRSDFAVTRAIQQMKSRFAEADSSVID